MVVWILLFFCTSSIHAMDVSDDDDSPPSSSFSQNNWMHATPSTYSYQARMQSLHFVTDGLTDIHHRVRTIRSVSDQRKANVLHLLQHYIDSGNSIITEVERAHSYERESKSKQAEFFLYGFGMARCNIQAMIEVLEQEAHHNDQNDDSLDAVLEKLSSLQINSDERK